MENAEALPLAEVAPQSGLFAALSARLERGEEETRFVIECASVAFVPAAIVDTGCAILGVSLGDRARPESDSEVRLRGDSVRATGELAAFVELPESAESRRILSSASTRSCLDSLSSAQGNRGLNYQVKIDYSVERRYGKRACLVFPKPLFLF